MIKHDSLAEYNMKEALVNYVGTVKLNQHLQLLKATRLHFSLFAFNRIYRYYLQNEKNTYW